MAGPVRVGEVGEEGGWFQCVRPGTTSRSASSMMRPSSSPLRAAPSGRPPGSPRPDAREDGVGSALEVIAIQSARRRASLRTPRRRRRPSCDYSTSVMMTSARGFDAELGLVQDGLGLDAARVDEGAVRRARSRRTPWSPTISRRHAAGRPRCRPARRPPPSGPARCGLVMGKIWPVATPGSPPGSSACPERGREVSRPRRAACAPWCRRAARRRSSSCGWVSPRWPILGQRCGRQGDRPEGRVLDFDRGAALRALGASLGTLSRGEPRRTCYFA